MANATGWIIAIILNVFGNFVCAYGWMLQKKTHNIEIAKLHAPNKHKNDTNTTQSTKENDIVTETELHETTLSYITNWKWWIGYITYGVGACFASAAYTFAPQSLLLPLESLMIIFNAIFGAKCLDEHLYKKDWIGIVLILIGSISVVLVGPKGDENGHEYTTKELEQLFRQPGFLIFISVFTVLIFIHYLTIVFRLYKTETFYMVGFTNISAYFGSWNGLCVTCGMLILASSVRDQQTAKDNFTHWLTYILAVMWVGTLLGLEFWRQKSLALYVSTYVSAIYRSLIIVYGILFGAVYFKDFQYSTDREIFIFCIGVAVIIVGVVTIAMKVDENDKLEDRKSKVSTSGKAQDKSVYEKANSSESEHDTDSDVNGNPANKHMNQTTEKI